MSDRPEWQQRVYAERDELSDKVSKLKAFLDTPKEVSSEAAGKHVWLLGRQLVVMQDYLDILDGRIALFADLK